MNENGRRIHLLRNRTPSIRSSATASIADIDEPDRNFIEENLKNLQEKSQAKRFAQDLYYSNYNGRSPMIRNARKPVHERLSRGSKSSFIPLGTNTSSLLPKARFQQNFNKQRFGGPKYGVSKTYSAQNRITRIRHQQSMSRALYGNAQHMGNNGPPLKLRRTLPTPYGRPDNMHMSRPNVGDLTVSVANPIHFTHKRFRIHLNRTLQNEIRAMQSRTTNREVLELERTAEIHFTDITLSHRFSNYS